MPKPSRRYWELVEPLFDLVKTDALEDFYISTKDINRPILLMFAAHFCLSEVHNGGFLQFFWNSTGILGPEAIEGFIAIGMPKLAGVAQLAAMPLGSPYPRDRDDRWDALLEASGRSEKELESIFKSSSNFYLAFEETTEPLNFKSLDVQAWELSKTENGDFGNAATRYAHSLNLFA